MCFPSDWPSDCPPEVAPPAQGVVYRLVKVTPLQEADFLSHKEMNRVPPTADLCDCCGLSVFRKKEEAIHMRRLFRKIGDYVAEGTLAKEHGVAMLTPGKLPTHTTWWPYEGVIRTTVFGNIEAIR